MPQSSSCELLDACAASLSDVMDPPPALGLPDGWSPLEVVSDSIVADGVTLRRAGMASRSPAGEEITGAAAEHHASPLGRASFELLERAGTISVLSEGRASPVRTREGTMTRIASAASFFGTSDAAERWRYSRSNGVALHTDWATAASRALEELVERDRVLRSWYGEIAPSPLSIEWSTTPVARARSYEWVAIELPAGPTGLSPASRVVSVFGLPRRNDTPLVFGHAARDTREAAFDAALRETMQFLAFLWGEPIVEEAPALVPTAGFHLDYWQVHAHHERLRRWLDGEHLRYRPASTPEEGDPDVTFVDLTPPWLHARGFCLAKAQSARATPLTFGDSPLGHHLPSELRFHPIA